ncbi:MAG TPA: dihydrodipicolinate synthase family protein [Microvirga sp.]|jgi:4-hydroxy-tetrahydrodipicolinate synthase|nr:dihydrodipicolinate synthase family protein [Microvirga sp.]
MTHLHRYHGVYPVLYAFFGRDGHLDREAMRRQVEHCIAAGAHGLMVPGLVTEVHKLTRGERQAVIGLVGELNGGRLPYAVTIGDQTAPEQLAAARAAREAGADWIILQPPAANEGGEPELIRFFGRTADAIDCPVAIQHNPFNLPVWLSVEGIIELHRQHPNFSVLKGEGTAVETEQLVSGTDGKLDVFGGHGGIEFLSILRAGAAGLIPAPDCLPVQVRIYELFRQGTPAALAEAERLHKELLPLIIFMVRSIPSLLCYGKRFMARRLELSEVVERQPALAPTPFGLAEMDRLFERLAALEQSALETRSTG